MVLLCLQRKIAKVRGNTTKHFINREIKSSAIFSIKTCFQKLFTRYNKLDLVFCEFIYFAVV